MSTADVAAGTGAYEERSLFVRKATGLVRGWAVRDAFIYSVFAINLVTLGFYIFSFAPFIPAGSLLWAVILSGAYLVFQAITYASLIAAMPRAGGDYVWMSRVLGGVIGLGIRTYARIQKFCFYGGVTGLAIMAILLLVNSKTSFISHFNTEAAQT